MKEKPVELPSSSSNSLSSIKKLSFKFLMKNKSKKKEQNHLMIGGKLGFCKWFLN